MKLVNYLFFGIIGFLFSACAIFAFTQTANAESQICDDYGFCMSTARLPKRFIALYGAFNEMLLALDCGDRIVARTQADDELVQLGHLPVIGTHMRPNPELVLAQKPDVILQMAGRDEAHRHMELFRQLGIPALVFNINSFADLFNVMFKLGELTGEQYKAARLVNDWKTQLQAIRQAGSRCLPKTVFFEARYPNLLAAGKNNIVDEIINIAGGENIVHVPKKLVRYSEEAVLSADPEIYLIQVGAMNPRPDPLPQRNHLGQLKAVRNGNWHLVDERIFSRPGPRNIEAARQLQEMLCPASIHNITSIPVFPEN